MCTYIVTVKVQELCESRGGRPGFSVLTSLTLLNACIKGLQHVTGMRVNTHYINSTRGTISKCRWVYVPYVLSNLCHFRLQMVPGESHEEHPVWCWCRQEASWWKKSRQAASRSVGHWALRLRLGTYNYPYGSPASSCHHCKHTWHDPPSTWWNTLVPHPIYLMAHLGTKPHLSTWWNTLVPHPIYLIFLEHLGTTPHLPDGAPWYHTPSTRWEINT